MSTDIILKSLIFSVIKTELMAVKSKTNDIHGDLDTIKANVSYLLSEVSRLPGEFIGDCYLGVGCLGIQRF